MNQISNNFASEKVTVDLVGELIPALKKHLQEMSHKIQEIIDASNKDDIIAAELLHDGADAIRIHEEMQKELCDQVRRILPSCEEQSLHVIEQLLVSAQQHREVSDEAKKALLAFRQVDVNHNSAREALRKCKEKALRIAEETNDAQLVDASAPFVLFLKIVDNPYIDITPAQEELIDREFSKPIPRLLYGGQFFFQKETIDIPDIPVDDYQPERFLFHTEKENSQFSATSFVKEIGKKSGNKKWDFRLPYGAQQRECLLKLGWCRVLTKEQIVRFCINKEDTEAIISKLARDGYISCITDTDSGVVSYSFSSKGIKMFGTESSREMLLSGGRRLPELLTSSEHLKEHLENIPLIIAINWVSLYLMDEYIPQYSKDCHIESSTTLIHHETQDNKIPYVLLSVKNTGTGQSNYFMVYPNVEMIEETMIELETAMSAISDDETVLVFVTISAKADSYKLCLPSCPHIQQYYASYDIDQNAVILWDSNGDHVELSVLFEDISMPNDEGIKALKKEEKATNQKKCEEEAAAQRKAEEEAIAREKAEEETAAYKKAEEEATAHKMAEEKPVLRADMTAREKADSMLRSNISPENTEEFVSLVNKLLQEGNEINDEDIVENSLTQALILTKALSFETSTPVYSELYKQLLLATDSPIDEHAYNGDSILTLFEGNERGTVLHLAALLRALFAPDAAYDYALHSYARTVFTDYEHFFERYPEMKQLLNLFTQINDLSATGFSGYILRQFSSQQAKDELSKQICETAERLYEEPVIKVKVTGIPKMKALCFGAESDLRPCIDIIRRNLLEDRELVQLTFEEYCSPNESGELSISQDKIVEAFERNWRLATDGEKTSRMHLISTPRDKILEGFSERLELMRRWMAATDPDSMANKDNGIRLIALHGEILKEMDAIIPIIREGYASYDCTILCAIIIRMRDKLLGQIAEEFRSFADVLRTGIFSVDNDGLPIINEKLTSVEYYEPWRNALRHIAVPVIGLREMLEHISNNQYSHHFDNMGLAAAICKYLNEHCYGTLLIEQYIKDVPKAKRTAEKDVDDFKGELEMAFAYGRITEGLKEDVLENIRQFEDDFLEVNDYGRLRAFLDAMRHIVLDATQQRYRELEQDIQSRRATNKKTELEVILSKAMDKLRQPEQNFVVAEEYINRFDAGNADEMSLDDSEDVGAFLSFISPKSFDELFRLCRKNQELSLRGFGLDYIENRLKNLGISKQYQESGKAMIRSLPNTQSEAASDRIRTLLLELGFSVGKVNNVSSGSSLIRFSADISPDSKDKAEYAHPVDIMGTKLRSPVDIICLFGKLQANDIVDKVCGLELSRTSIVFMNGALDLAARRQIAERFHRDKSGQNPFLLIDWVLLLHLALHQKTERLPILLNCTLPYTSSFQPFVKSGAVSDEMFIGRKKELNQILDPNGPVIVYGGRQLGKTALLERALSRTHRPAKKEYAVYASALSCGNESELVDLLATKISEAGLQMSNVHSIKELYTDLKQKYVAKEWSRLLLLIDEADKILASIRMTTPAYAPLNPLSDLKRETKNDFKFVLAGLHNVCRAATDPNTIFGQLGGALCIKPLTSSDALQLLAKPLRYLGFQVDNAHLEHILVNTSFYPGIIHYVGYSLVENLSTKYGDYYQAVRGAPPYDLNDKQLGFIMSNDALNEQINQKIRWTLEVDPRYFMLARCIACLYYDYPNNNKAGYSTKQILEYADLLDIASLKDIEQSECTALLLELVEMGILVKPTTDSFRLRQRRFLEAIGNNPERIEMDIIIAEGRNEQ